MRRSLGLVLLVSVALTTTACGSEVATVRVVSTVPAYASASSGVTDPAGSGGPAATGTLQWSACPEHQDFDCARMSVPVDYANPDGKTIQIAVNRHPATDPAHRIGALVMNPGGPGASGVDAAYDLALDLPDGIAARFDLVGFDPRGVGGSSPVICSTDAEKDRTFALDQTPDTRAEIDDLVNAELNTNAGCVAASGELLPFLSTYDSARDLDRLRQALGDEQLTFLGFSYGTHLGATYAELFPGAIRAMVLDGPVNPATGYGQDDSSTGDNGFDTAFDRFAEACTAATACPAKPDAAALRKKLEDKVEKDPIPASADQKRRLTTGLLDTAISAALYDEGSWPFLAIGMVDADKGDSSVLLALADNYVGRDVDGHYQNLDDAFRVINCADATDHPDADIVRADAARLKVPPDDGDLGQVLYEASCAGLPEGDAPFQPLSAKGAAPIVVIGTKGDPATVVTNAPKLAKALGSGVSVIWDGDGHTAFPKTTCIAELVTHYLVDLSVPKDDTHCPADDPAPAGTAATTVPAKDGVSSYRLDRDTYRDGLTSQFADALGSPESSTCVVDVVSSKFDDTQFVHTVLGVDIDGLFTKIRTIANRC